MKSDNEESDRRFERAKFYDCKDDEVLTHELPEDAIEELFDDMGTPYASVTSDVHVHGPVTVRAFDLRSIDASYVHRLADNLAERLVERLHEDYGDRDGDPPISVDRAAILLQPIVQAIVDEAKVWTCHEVGQRTYSVEEVLEILRRRRPDWFEVSIPPTAPPGDEVK